jgi:hypothetical protein
MFESLGEKTPIFVAKPAELTSVYKFRSQSYINLSNSNSIQSTPLLLPPPPTLRPKFSAFSNLTQLSHHDMTDAKRVAIHE